MVRKFKVDVGRFHKGDVRDYPQHVWKDIATSAGRPLNNITDHVVTHRDSSKQKKGR